MNIVAYMRSLAARVLRRSQVDADIDEEIRCHIESRADDLERSGGLSRAEALRRARIEFGGPQRFREECEEQVSGHFFETLVQDLRVSLRALRKAPGFTVVAVATLALAIGANAVVFGVMNGLVLRPLNVPQAGNLYGTVYGDDSGWQSYPNYVDLRDRNHSFEDLAAFKFAFVGLDTGKDPVVSFGFSASGNYFDVLGIQPHLGRLFHGFDEHGPNSAPYIVLSYAYWQRRFLGDAGVVGRTVRLNKHPFTIIGVAPPEFRGTLLFISPDFFMPIVNQEQVDGEALLNARGNSTGVFEAFGHLKPGVTPEQATADVNALRAHLAKTYPQEFGHKESTLSHPGLTAFGAPARAFVAGLMALASLILLAACANLGNLFGARAADRGREVALRLALGASRGRILRGLFTEAMLISLMGGAVGLLGSNVLLWELSQWQPFPAAPIHLPVNPDPRVYVAALVLAVVSGLLFGIVPVRQVLRANPYEVVKAGSSAKVGHRVTVRDLLLVGQIAICAVLVTSSFVAVRGLMRSLRGDIGIEPRNTVLANVNLAMAGYTADAVVPMQKRMISALETIPGVDAVGLVNRYPQLVNGAVTRDTIFKEDATELRPGNAAALPYRYEVSPNYFRAAGTALLSGRAFSAHDDTNAPLVAVVNKQFAIVVFGSVGGALGRVFKLQDGKRIQVAGVLEDGKYLSLTEDPQPAMFLPFPQWPSSAAHLVVRSTRDPGQLSAVIRNKLHELDAGLPVDTETWRSLMEVVMFPSRVATLALGVLGVMGAMLSITGIFGMAAYSVTRRLKEIGIRLALGAQRHEVLQAALGRAFTLLALGSVGGLLLGVAASQVLAAVVYQATPRDPLVIAGVVLAMLLLGLVATWIPAQRAMSVDPLTLLREE